MGDGTSSGSGKAGRNLPIAILTGLALAGAIFGTLLTSGVAWFILLSSAVLLAQVELLLVLRTAGYRPSLLLGVASGAAIMLGAATGGTRSITLALTLSVIAAFLWFLVEPKREGVADSIGSTVLSLLYVPFLGAHALLLRDLPHGESLTITYIGAVAFYDIAAFASGVKFGRHLIAPRISPKKSWEGAAGATIFVFASAMIIAPLIGPLTVLQSAIFAGVVCVLAPIGDFVESMIKRDLGVKDMGSFLPGHGGMLDRLDALLLVAPAAYWVLRVMV